MADSTLAITLSARNLTTAAFKELKASLEGTNTAFTTTAKAGKKAGEDVDAGMKVAGKSASTAASAISQGLGVAIPLSLAAATTAVVAFGVDSVKSFADLDKQLHGVNSLLGLTGDDAKKSFDAMSADIRGFATRMGVDAVGATKALYDIVSSGVTKPADAMKVLEVAQRAAIGGMTDAATTADGLTSVLNAYGLSADHADEVSDQMFQTVNIGKVTMAELSSQIGKVVPIAAGLGISFDQVGAAIATMTKQGITAGAAFTDTQQILNQYLKPTAEAAELSKALGLEFSATSVRAKGLQGSLDDAFDKTGGNKELLGRLFGSVEAVNGVLALTGKNAQGAAKDLADIGKSAGAQSKAFDEMEGSASRNAEKMQTKFREVGFKLGESMVPALTDIAKFVDLVGQNLGLWPKDVPSSGQVENMRGLAKAAEDTAKTIKTVGDAYTYLDEHIRSSQKVGATPEAIGGQFGAQARAAIDDAIKGLDGYEKKQLELSGAVRAGTITQAEADKQLAKYVTDARAAAVAASTHRTEQQKLDDAYHDGLLGPIEYADAVRKLAEAQAEATRAEAQGDQARTTSLDGVQEAIAGVVREAEAKRTAAAEDQRLSDERSKSAEQRVKDAEKAVEAEKDAQRAAKAAADKAIADAKRYAEQVAQANEQASKSYRKLTSDIEDIVDDGNGRLQEIRDRHDHDYNQAIVDAQRDQAKIYADGASERVRIEEDAAERTAEVQNRLNDLQAGRDQQASDRRLQESRRLQDQEYEDAQRAADRRTALERRAQDQRIADQEKAEDRARERRQAAEERDQAIRDAAAAKTELDTSAGDSAAEREKANAKTAADAQKQYDRDVADAKKKLDQELADAAQNRLDDLADASSEEQKARIEREYGQEVARIQRQADADKEKRDERYADEAAKRDERYADEEAKAQAQYDRDLKRADDALKKHLDDLAAREKEQVESEQRQDDRDQAHRSLADQRAREDQDTADRRDQTARNLRESRDKADWEAQRKRAEEALQDDLKKIAKKKDDDITATQEREAAAIKASNDTLIEKQNQIDAQRDTDFGKFSEDMKKRFRELGQQFGAAMGDLVKLIPAKVDWFISGGATQIAQAAALLNSGSQPASTGGPSGSGTLREGGKPGETQAEVDNFNRNAAKANEDNIRRAAGLGAGGAGTGPGGGSDTGQDVFAQIIADLGVELGGINQRFGQALIGGDTATARGETPKNVTIAGGNEDSLAWAQQYLGSHAFDGMCERFVEMANGTSGRFASAKAAADALQVAGGRMEDAPRGSLMFFRPDPSNGNWGHVGISRGGGQMISATNGGVTIDGPSNYWSRLYSGYGPPRFADGGRVPGAAGRAVPIIAHEGEVVLNAKEQQVINDLVGDARSAGRGIVNPAPMGAGVLSIILEIDGQRFASAMAPYTQGALDRHVRLRLG